MPKLNISANFMNPIRISMTFMAIKSKSMLALFKPHNLVMRELPMELWGQ